MKCIIEFSVYVREIQHKNLLFVCLYVDDLIITRDVNEEIKQFKEKMKSEFDMTDLGILHSLVLNLCILKREFSYTRENILVRF